MAGLTNLLSGDDVQAMVGATGDKGAVPLGSRAAAGSYALVPVGLAGAEAGNYVLGGGTAGLLTIERRAISYGIGDQHSVYGDLASPSVSLIGVLAGDAVAGSISVTKDDVPITLDARIGVGNYALSFDGLVGSAAANYVASGSDGALTVIPRALRYSIANLNTVYGDLATPVASFTNLLAGDDVVAVLNRSFAPRSPVGSYSVGVSGIAGADAQNYAIHGGTPGLVTIAPRPVTYVVASGSSTYGDLFTPNALISGLLAGDSARATIGATLNGSRVPLAAKSGVGSYLLDAIGLTGADAGNYTIAANGNRSGQLTINPRPIGTDLVVSRQYGTTYVTLPNGRFDPSVERVMATNVADGDYVTAQLQLLDATGRPVDYSTRSNAGSYGLTIRGLAGESDAVLANYVIDPARLGRIDITPAPLDSVRTSLGQSYGDATPIIGGATGVFNGDDASIVWIVADGRLSGAGVPTVGYHSLRATGITGSAAGNYYLRDVDRWTPDLYVSPLPLGGVSFGGTMTRVYGSDGVPTVTFHGVLPGDQLLATRIGTGSGGALGVRTDAGSYSLSVSMADVGGRDAGNYAASGVLVPLIGPNQFTITKRPISFVPAALVQTYGEYEAPSLVGVVSGDEVFANTRLLNSSGLEVSGQPDAGTYSLTSALSGSHGRNYDLIGDSQQSGTLTITPRQLSFTGTADLIYGDGFTTAGLSSLFSGLVARDVGRIAPVYLDSNGSAVTGQVGARYFNVGTYGLTLGSLGGAAAGNYVLAENGATVRITPYELNWRLGASHVYGSYATVDGSYNVLESTGYETYLIYRSAVGELVGVPQRLSATGIRLDAVIPSLGGFAPPDRLDVGVYTLAAPKLIGIDAGNFTLAATPLSVSPLTITPRPIGVDVPAQSGEFGRNSSFSLAGTVKGVLSGDLVNPLFSVGGSINGAGLTPGTYAVDVSLGGVDAGNYMAVLNLDATAWRPFTVTPMRVEPVKGTAVYGSIFDPWTMVPTADAEILRRHDVGIASDAGTLSYSARGSLWLTGTNADWFRLGDKRASFDITPRPVKVGGPFSVIYGDFSTTGLDHFEKGVIGGTSGILPGTEILTQYQTGQQTQTLNVGTYPLSGLSIVVLTRATTQDLVTYRFDIDPGQSLSVVPRPLTISPAASGTIYGNQVTLLGLSNLSRYAPSASVYPLISVTGYAGPLAPDGFAELATWDGAERQRTRTYANVGTYTYRLTGISDANYTIAADSQTEFSFTIAPRLVSSFRLEGPSSITYGDSASLLGYSYITPPEPGASTTRYAETPGLLTGDAGRILPVWASSSATFLDYIQQRTAFGRDDIAPPDVGTYDYTLTGFGGERGANYAIAPATRTLEITPRTFRYVIDTNRWYGDQITDCPGCGMRPNPSPFYQPGPIVPNTDMGIRVTLLDQNGRELSYSPGLNAGTYRIRTNIIGTDAHNYIIDAKSISPDSMTIKKSILGYQISAGFVHYGSGEYYPANPGQSNYIRGIGFTADRAGELTLNGVYGDDPVTALVGLFKGTDVTDRSSAYFRDMNMAPAGEYHLQLAGISANWNNYELAPVGSPWAAGAPVTVYDFSNLFAILGNELANPPAPSLVTRTPAAQASNAPPVVPSGAQAASQLQAQAATVEVAGTGTGGSSRGVSGSTAVHTQGGFIGSLGTVGVVGVGGASADAEFDISLGKVKVDVGADASGSIRMEYGPGYTEVGGSVDAHASGSINLLSTEPSITGSVAAGADVYVLTGVAGGLGNGAEGALDASAGAWAGAEAEAGLSVKDGKFNVGGSVVVGGGASAGANGSVGGDLGSVAAGTTVYSPGVVAGGFSPSAGFSDGTLSFGGQFSLALGFGGISFNFEVAIDFEAVGGHILAGLTAVFDVLDDHFSNCDRWCQAERQEEKEHQMRIAKIMAMDPFSHAEAILNVATNCRGCDYSGDTAARVEDARVFLAAQKTVEYKTASALRELTKISSDPSHASLASILPQLVNTQNQVTQALNDMNNQLGRTGRRLEVSAGGKISAVAADRPMTTENLTINSMFASK